MGTHVENRDNPKTIEKTMRIKGIIMFRGTKTASIFHLFSCAMLEAPLRRNKTLPKRSWDAPRTFQDAPGRLLDSKWGELGGYWVHLGPQDGPKTQPKPKKKDQNWSKTEFYAQEPPRSAQEPFKAPLGRWGTPPGVGLGTPKIEPSWGQHRA